jgi:cytochrome c-type biogenesis protein CcmF
MALAHFGIGITLFGVVCEMNWSAEQIVALKPHEIISLAGYDLTFDAIDERPGPNYRETVARFTVRRDGATLATMEPSKRSFPDREMVTTEAALLTRGVSQLYLAIGDVNRDGPTTVRLYYKPLVLLIWIGALVMALGGAFSFSDRRLRVGAPKPARARRAMQPAV